jgi:hypothetical protein
LLDDTAKRLKVKNSYDVSENVEAAVKSLSDELTYFGGHIIEALEAYHDGRDRVVKHQVSNAGSTYAWKVYLETYRLIQIMKAHYLDSKLPKNPSEEQARVDGVHRSITSLSIWKAPRPNLARVISCNPNSESDIRVPFGKSLVSQFPGPEEFMRTLLEPVILMDETTAMNEDQGLLIPNPDPKKPPIRANKPLESRITFTFAYPTKVSAIEVHPHTNGVTLYKICPGDRHGVVALDANQCEEHVQSEIGDRTEGPGVTGFEEKKVYHFRLNKIRVFNSIIIEPEKTFLGCGAWALYRIQPIDEKGQLILPVAY